MGREREIKAGLADGAALPSLDALPGVADVQALDPQDLDAEYWDTDALDLLAVGATLRRRTGESAVPRWTLKVPAGAATPGAEVLERVELDVDRDVDEPPAELLEPVRAITASPVAPVARLRSLRRRWRLLDASGAVLAEVDDDRVTATVPGRAPTVFREVEAELADGAPVELERELARRLTVAGASPADPRPKLAQALATPEARG